MSERLDLLRWDDVAARGMPQGATRFAPAAGVSGRVADVTADVAAAGLEADVTSRGTNPGVASEGLRETESGFYGLRGGHYSEGTRVGPSDRNDPTVEGNVSRGSGAEVAQDSSLREPRSEGIELATSAGRASEPETGSSAGKGLETGGGSTAATANRAGSLPVAPKKKSAKAELQELGPALAGMRILVAEDTPILQVS